MNNTFRYWTTRFFSTSTEGRRSEREKTIGKPSSGHTGDVRHLLGARRYRTKNKTRVRGQCCSWGWSPKVIKINPALIAFLKLLAKCCTLEAAGSTNMQPLACLKTCMPVAAQWHEHCNMLASKSWLPKVRCSNMEKLKWALWCRKIHYLILYE